MAKFKFSRPVTPKGIAKFVYDTEPQEGYKKGDEPKYKIRLLLDDTDENRAWIEKTLETGKAEAKKAGVKLKKKFNDPFKYPEDQDEDDYVPAEGKEYAKLDEDHKGRIFVEFKSGYPPGRIDAKKQPLDDDVKIMNGDIVRVKTQLNPYEGLGSGIGLYFVTVQLIEKNSIASGGGLDDDGFDEEDEGYSQDEEGEGDDDNNEGNNEDLDDEIPF